MNAYQAGQVLLCGDYSCYTPTGKSFFQKNKRWFTDPASGDVVYFYTSSMGRVSHVGIVYTALYSNGTWSITTIEGNTAAGKTFERDGGEVAIKSYNFTPRQVGGTNRINGFGRPLFGTEHGTCSAEMFLAIARDEVGYVEKASKSGIYDKTANPGAENYTKYNEWAVNSGWGYQPAQWCQTFVSWCAYMACKKARETRPAAWIQQDNGKWTYRKSDGSFAQNEWCFIDGRWYVFDGAGYMVKGWFRSEEGWYFLANDGGMISSQWMDYSGKSYYFTASGLMATDAYVKSTKAVGPGEYMYYFVNSKGEWEPSRDTDKPALDKYDIVI